MESLIEYFSGDTMASDAWSDKYRVKSPVPENTPTDMHRRLAKEFAVVEYAYGYSEKKNIYGKANLLSEFGRQLINKRFTQTVKEIEDEIFSYFDRFKHIVPQGSIMSNLGNISVFGTLSNCFVIASPEDSYGGIMRADEELIQLMKRRGGVGTSLDNLRPMNAAVTNAAKSSTGVPSFAERYSNSTREVAQEGRRGALMLLLHVAHPDIFGFVKMKADRTKVTGANISVKFTDKFLEAVKADEDFYCTFPVSYSEYEIDFGISDPPPYNVMTSFPNKKGCQYIMRIRAAELFDEFVNMAWDNAEPGAAYIDRIQRYAPDGVYPRFRAVSCNPCGEIWMGDYDACRLIAQNLFSLVKNPFTKEAEVDFEKLYEVSYMQQRLSDNLIDLEAQYIDRILLKLRKDPESLKVRQREIDLWEKVKEITLAGRRTGNGITGLGDMLAALGHKYGSEESIFLVEQVMSHKMKAELDATIDMAITRGAFEDWDSKKEFVENPGYTKNGLYKQATIDGTNDFFEMLIAEFPEQAIRMQRHGRRNVSWSTVAPTGTVSLMTQTTSGLEPLFKAFYIRRRKISTNMEGARVDFIDQSGDKWMEYPVLHPKFKMWLHFTNWQMAENTEEQLLMNVDALTKEETQRLFEASPYYGSEADDISWEQRISMQAVIQRYTSNAISSTINLPKDVSKETVKGIYLKAWEKGLKGVTIYRDGSRTGVLVTEQTKKVNQDSFGYTDAIKRPEALDADYHCVTVRGQKFAVIVGKLNDNPYELFAFEDPLCETILTGKIVKKARGRYAFESPNYNIKNLQLNADQADEKLLTRWVSLLLRHGANPKFIAEQVEKSQLMVTSFAKVIARVLKHYIPDEVLSGEACTNCGEHTMVREEGCKKCSSCGHSKC